MHCEQKWFQNQTFWVCELVVQPSSYICSKCWCSLNQQLCWFKMVVLVQPAFENCWTSIFWRFNQHQHFEPTKLDGWTFIKWWLNQLNAKNMNWVYKQSPLSYRTQSVSDLGRYNNSKKGPLSANCCKPTTVSVFQVPWFFTFNP